MKILQYFWVTSVIAICNIQAEAIDNNDVAEFSDNDIIKIQLKLWINLNTNIQLLKEVTKENNEKLKNLQVQMEALDKKIDVKFRQVNQKLTQHWESNKIELTQLQNEVLKIESQTENNQEQLTSAHNGLKNAVNNLKTSLDAIKNETEIAYSVDCFSPNLNNCTNSQCYIHNQIYGPQAFWVPCDQQTDNGGWTVIQRRLNGSVDFNRNWQDYKEGFGDLDGSFWLGLDKIHALTSTANMELRIILRDLNDTEIYANYNAFKIGNETEKYQLQSLGPREIVQLFIPVAGGLTIVIPGKR